jgi:hypothetical protein
MPAVLSVPIKTPASKVLATTSPHIRTQMIEFLKTIKPELEDLGGCGSDYSHKQKLTGEITEIDRTFIKDVLAKIQKSGTGTGWDVCCDFRGADINIWVEQPEPDISDVVYEVDELLEQLEDDSDSDDSDSDDE